MSKNGQDLVFTGERFVPGIDDYKLEMEHIQRYRMAQQLVNDKVVLDAACGEGYGSALLAEKAAYVIGIDISEKGISHARYRYADKQNLIFEVKNVGNLVGISPQSIDIVVSFETIEHLNEDTQKRFLKEIKRVLKPDGLLIMSTPNKKIYSDLFHYHNEYHIHEFSQRGFVSFLKTRFKNVKLLSQSFEVDCVISDLENSNNALSFVNGNKNPLDTCKFFIALASNKEIPSNNFNSVYLGNYGEYNERILRILELQDAEEQRNNHIKMLDGELDEKGQYIRSLQNELVEKGNSIRSLQDEAYEKEHNFDIKIEESRVALQLVSDSFSSKLQSLQEKNDELKYKIVEAEKKFDESRSHVRCLEEEKILCNERLKTCEEELRINVEMLQSKEQLLLQIQDKYAVLGKEVELYRQLYEKVIEEKEELNTKFEEQVEISNNELEELRGKYENCLRQIQIESDEYERQIDEFRLSVKSIFDEKVKIELELKQCENDFEIYKDEHEQKIELLTAELEKSNNQSAILEDRLILKERDIQEKERDINNRDDEITELSNRLNNILDMYEDKQKELRQLIKNRDGHIELLQEKEREFNRIQASRSYKIGQKIHRISEIVLPGGSTRRFILGTGLKIIRHPIKMFKFLNPHRIGKFFWLLRMGGMDAVQYRFRVLEANELVEHESMNTSINYDITELSGDRKSISEYEIIEFEKFAIPEVSIIIPVYNQFPYTYECLKSIQKNTESVSYEIIIADDNSSDITTDVNKVIRNITVVRNEGERGFLPNCNNAAIFAKGKYLLFLNNDTQVQSNWLKPLVTLMEQDESIGMTGGKLVYANGLLQEAGGILWKDGSAWNYGNQKSPDDPEYNYVREVDYISGASIMIRHNLWEKVGGFDERYTPAYYEDTDLAFQVRENDLGKF